MKRCGRKNINLMRKILISYTVLIITLMLNVNFSAFSKCSITHQTITPKYSLEEYERLEKRIWETGDKEAYYKYIITNYDFGMLPYAIIMAEKYKLPSAYDDAYYALMDLYEYNKIKMDSTTWNQALHFLEKGAELNDSNCIKTLYDIYKNGNEYTTPDSTKCRYYENLKNKDAVLKRD